MIIPHDYQNAASDWLTMTKRGAVKSPAGSGKTVIAALAFRKVMNMRKRQHVVKVGIMVNTQEQCQQFYKAWLQMFYDMNVEIFMAQEEWERVCDTGEGRAFELKVACAAADTDWSDRDLLIIDENHHSLAQGWRRQIETCSKSVWGFTATPPEDPQMFAEWSFLFGNKIYEIDRSNVTKNLASARVLMLNATDDQLKDVIDADIDKRIEAARNLRWHLENENYVPTARQLLGIQTASDMPVTEQVRQSMARQIAERGLKEEHAFKLGSVVRGIVYSRVAFASCVDIGIVQNRRRNDAVVRLATKHKEDQTLVLVNQVEHGQMLSERIPGSIVCFSKMGKKKRSQAINDFKNNRVKCLIATSLLDEGFDAPNANVLIMCSGGRSSRAVEQRTGRVLRAFKGKTHGQIYDFIDIQYPLMYKHSQKRIEVYKKLEYEITYE